MPSFTWLGKGLAALLALAVGSATLAAEPGTPGQDTGNDTATTHLSGVWAWELGLPGLLVLAENPVAQVAAAFSLLPQAAPGAPFPGAVFVGRRSGDGLALNLLGGPGNLTLQFSGDTLSGQLDTESGSVPLAARRVLAYEGSDFDGIWASQSDPLRVLSLITVQVDGSTQSLLLDTRLDPSGPLATNDVAVGSLNRTTDRRTRIGTTHFSGNTLSGGSSRIDLADGATRNISSFSHTPADAGRSESFALNRLLDIPQPVTESPVPAPDPAPDGATPEDTTQDDGLALARRENCFACHDIDQRLVGPSFTQINVRLQRTRARDPDASLSQLAERIRNGSVGIWGPVPMPPNPQISEADATRLATWIANLR